MVHSTGSVDFTVNNETYQTWYRIIGDLNSGGHPLIILHGGSGMTHDYLLPNADLHTSLDVPIIFYDQVGNGKSTHILDKPKEFWTVKLFMDELDNFLAKLGVGEFDLLGHSWGGVLAINFAIEREPKGLKKIVLVGTPASMELWVKSARGLLENFPKDFVDMMKRHEEEGTTGDKEYQDGMWEFYGKHVITLPQPLPKEINVSVEALEKNGTVYETMWGPSEFFATGILKHWNIIDQLEKTKYPVMITNGVHDECQDLCVLPLFEKIPKVKWYQFANSTHMPFWEERERYISVVSGFLAK
ncbi:proline-specific peptidase [Cyathus striatus]|nr:proline-specific peptidase [Cyathus striatus]